MKKIGIIGGGFILSAALLVSSAGGVLAAGSEAAPAVTTTAQVEQEYQGMFGTVSNINTSNNESTFGSLMLQTKSGDNLEVLLDEDTIYKMPGKEDASVDDIEEGNRLAIQANNTNTAICVMVVPDAATYTHMNGVVVSTQEQTMTIMNNSGETHQVNLPEGVQGAEVGELVTLAVQNGSGEGPLEASGLQNANMIQERLVNQLGEMAGQGTMTQAEMQNMNQLKELCNQLTEQHMEILQGVLEEAPEGAKAAIQEQLQLQIKLQSQIAQATNGENAGSGGQNSN